MREVKVKVFEFKELDEDVQEAIINNELESSDISSEIEEFMDQHLSNQGLPLTVEQFSMGDDEVDDHVYLQGELSEHLSYWNKHEESALFHLISSIFVDSDESSDENPAGISIFFKEDVDEESEEVQKLQTFFKKQLEVIEEDLVEQAQEFYEKRSADIVKKITAVLSDFEYLADGTVFEKEMEG